MKTIDRIPTSKIGRTSELVKTGVKIGGNYLKYYGKKVIDPSLSKEELNHDNASDIYDGLKNLKGSALKVAQMLSMEKNLLPKAYVERFSLSQFSVPPLSAPLVRKTFKTYLGQYPDAFFDTFTANSVNAASIGQVHKATKDGKELAVKIQYPGVSDSIASDLAVVRPIAIKMFNLQGKETDKYFDEIKSKLVEETNYNLELEQSIAISNACAFIPNLSFPSYYPEFSSEKILTMDWMDGVHLSEFTATAFTKKQGDLLGQTLWDFYMYQMHELKMVHADPHPGNFLVTNDHQLVAIDFGCMKKVPLAFYIPYFDLAKKENLEDREFFNKKLYELEILLEEDTEQERLFFSDLFHEMLSLFTSPFHNTTFDFSDEVFWSKITDLSQKYSSDSELKKMNGSRGSRHFLYINRTFFGLYHLLHDLKAEVSIHNYTNYLK